MKKRLKIIIPLLALLAICLYFRLYYTRGHARNAELDYGNPQLYTLDAVQEAGDRAIEHFETYWEYTGCKLRRISYDEELSREASKYSPKDVIIFTIEYKVGWFPPEGKKALWEGECNIVLNRSGEEGSWLVETGEG